MGRACARLILDILVPDMSNELFIHIQGHYTGYPSGGVRQSDKDFQLIIERDALPHSVRKIVARLIAYYLGRWL